MPLATLVVRYRVNNPVSICITRRMTDCLRQCDSGLAVDEAKFSVLDLVFQSLTTRLVQ